MPNWCENIVSVYGPEEVLALFKERAKEGDVPLSFTKLYPIPEELKEDWYTWNVDHWGTKWDLDEGTKVIYDEPTQIIYRFDTAWSPPEALFAHASGMFPDLTFQGSYSEPGMDFSGSFVHGNAETYPEVDLPSASSFVGMGMNAWEPY